MSPSLPTFVVVGHVNKGKSSVVATLTEDSTVPIDWTPGTTAISGAYTLVVGGQPVLRILDTPGFQEAPAVLDWMKKRANSAADRRESVVAFIEEHRGQDRFCDEVALLESLISDQTGILYVVDGSRPYRPSHEAEMEILRWTGQPGMALINCIGDADHREEWKRVLLQFFNAVRDFNAHDATFEQRVRLLLSFSEVREEWKPAVQTAVVTLKNERSRRDQEAARLLGLGLQQILAHVEKLPVPASGPPPNAAADLQARYQNRLQQMEANSREQIDRLYGHDKLQSASGKLEVLDEDLFSQTSWKVFGLTQKQLTLYSAGWGAVLGGGLDLMVGGLSFGAGVVLGALTGGVSAWLGSTKLSKDWDSSSAVFQRMFPGETGRYQCFGPLSNPRFAWVLMDRALLHWMAVRDRAHASSATVDGNKWTSDGKQGVVAHLPSSTRDALDKGLRHILQAAKAGKNWPPDQQIEFVKTIQSTLSE